MKKYASKVRAAGGRKWADVGQRSNRGAIRNGGYIAGECEVSVYQKGVHAYLEGKSLPYNCDRRMVHGWQQAFESDKKFIEQLLAAGKCADGAIARVHRALEIQAQGYYNKVA